MREDEAELDEGSGDEAEVEGDVFFGVVVVEKAGRVAGGGEAKGAGDFGGRDAMEGGFFGVDEQLVFGLGGLDVPVDVDDAIEPFHDLFDLAGDLEAAIFGGAVDFGDHRLEYERAGGGLGDFDIGPVGAGGV